MKIPTPEQRVDITNRFGFHWLVGHWCVFVEGWRELECLPFKKVTMFPSDFPSDLLPDETYQTTA